MKSCKAACSQGTLTSDRAPAQLHHTRPVRLQRSMCSPPAAAGEGAGWQPPGLRAGGPSTVQRGHGPSQRRSPRGCNGLMGAMLPGLVLNVCARGNFVFSICFQCLTVRVIQPLHRLLGSTRAAQRNKWFLLEAVGSLPQNSFLSVNAHLINLKCSVG